MANEVTDGTRDLLTAAQHPPLHSSDYRFTSRKTGIEKRARRARAQIAPSTLAIALTHNDYTTRQGVRFLYRSAKSHKRRRRSRKVFTRPQRSHSFATRTLITLCLPVKTSTGVKRCENSFSRYARSYTAPLYTFRMQVFRRRASAVCVVLQQERFVCVCSCPTSNGTYRVLQSCIPAEKKALYRTSIHEWCNIYI